jgi:hypothetical protein
MRYGVVGAVAIIVGAGSLAWADSGGFTFSTPPRWLNVSPGAAAADRVRIPAAMREQVDSGKFAFYAADVDHGDDGFIASVNAIVTTESPPAMSAAGLDELLVSIAKPFRDTGLEYESVKTEIVPIGGVNCARLVGNIRTATDELTSLQYAIPGRGAAAILSFMSQRKTFPRYEAIFDAAARQTQGAARPPVQTPFWLYGVIASVSAAVASIMAVRQRQKKTSANASNEKPPAPVP